SKRSLQVTRSLKPLLRVLCKRSLDYSREWRRLHKRSRLALQNRRDHARRALPFECSPSREHLVQHAAEAEQIAARVGLFSVQLLRRHVLQSSENLSLPRKRR